MAAFWLITVSGVRSVETVKQLQTEQPNNYKASLSNHWTSLLISCLCQTRVQEIEQTAITMTDSILAEHQPLYSLPNEVLGQIVDYLP